MNKELFIKTVSEKMNVGKCELFVGSGISSGSKLPGWKELLEPLADNIGLKITDDDLPMIAQYIVNDNSGNRNCINNRIEECLNKKDFELNTYHYALANMNVNRVWTTNYDCLLEKCYASRRPNVIKSNSDLAKKRFNMGLEIIKIHGSLDGDLDEIVLTKQDYDEILFKKTALTQKLEDSFMNNSFLFIGYGYRDPDIRNLMVTATMKCKSNYCQDHYIVLNKPNAREGEQPQEFKRREKLFGFWCKELNRIGIRELIIDNNDLTEVLQKIALKSRGKSIFVSGSHEKDSENLYNDYGKQLATMDDIIMVNGQNQGVGIKVVSGFMEIAVKSKKELNGIMKMFPNPYAANHAFSNDESLLDPLKAARESLFAGTQLFVVFAGAMGTDAEYEVAKEMNCTILPAIVDENDYKNQLIQKMLKDGYCVKVLEKVPGYKEKLDHNEIPSLDDLVNATESLLNG